MKLFDETKIKNRICKIGGFMKDYNICSSKIDAYDDIKNKTYLGKGTIYSINDVVQNPASTELLHFWESSNSWQTFLSKSCHELEDSQKPVTKNDDTTHHCNKCKHPVTVSMTLYGAGALEIGEQTVHEGGEALACDFCGCFDVDEIEESES